MSEMTFHSYLTTRRRRKNLFYELCKLLVDFFPHQIEVCVDGVWSECFSIVGDGDLGWLMDGVEELMENPYCDAIRVLLEHRREHTIYCFEIDSQGQRRFHMFGQLQALELEGYVLQALKIGGDEEWAGGYSGESLTKGYEALFQHPYCPEVIVTADSVNQETFGVRFQFSLRGDVQTVEYRSDQQVQQAA
jgi:hypothetical protein